MGERGGQGVEGWRDVGGRAAGWLPMFTPASCLLSPSALFLLSFICAYADELWCTGREEEGDTDRALYSPACSQGSKVLSVQKIWKRKYEATITQSENNAHHPDFDPPCVCASNLSIRALTLNWEMHMGRCHCSIWPADVTCWQWGEHNSATHAKEICLSQGEERASSGKDFSRAAMALVPSWKLSGITRFTQYSYQHANYLWPQRISSKFKQKSFSCWTYWMSSLNISIPKEHSETCLVI